MSEKEKEKVVTQEERAQIWEDYVRREINALLNIYLPISVEGNIGIQYSRPIVQQFEAHTVYDEDKASGVHIDMVFKFDKPIDIPKGNE